MRALIYARVSKDKKGESHSVAEQETECRAWAERMGWTITKVVSETGSASRYARSTGARTKWDEVTQALSSAEFDILLTWENSRATRELDVYAELRNLCVRTGVLWGYSGTVFNLSDRSDRFRTGLDALQSEDESHRTSERVSRSVRARALAGEPHGKIPYGYRREYNERTGALLRQVPDEERAPIVRGIYRQIADGHSLYAVARDLTARGIPTPRPARRAFEPESWIAVTVRNMVRRPAYIGKRVHRGEVIGDASWPALVDEELWTRANAALDAKPATNPTGDHTATWLLSGIARCGNPECGGPMRRQKNGNSNAYLCGKCIKVGRTIGRTDEVVIRKLLALLELAPTGDTQDSAPEVRTALDEAAALQARLDALVDQATDGQLSAASLARAEQRLLPQIRAARQRARALSVPAALAGYDLSDPTALWASLDMAGKRALLRKAVRVTIHSSGGSRIWRDDLIDVTPTWL